MARIAGVNIPLNKRAEIGLMSIYGVGRSTSAKVLKPSAGELLLPCRQVFTYESSAALL